MARKPPNNDGGHINWLLTPIVAIAKSTSGYIHAVEEVHGESALYVRFGVAYPTIIQTILGQKVTTAGLSKHIRDTQPRAGALTPNKLYQRGHKVKHYSEKTPYDQAVAAVFRGTYTPDLYEIIETERDEKRNFTKLQLQIAIEQQDFKCYYCFRPIGGLWKAVGDHIFAWARGGRTVQNNCAATCQPCNKAKLDLLEAEYRSLLRVQAQDGRMDTRLNERIEQEKAVVRQWRRLKGKSK